MKIMVGVMPGTKVTKKSYGLAGVTYNVGDVSFLARPEIEFEFIEKGSVRKIEVADG